MDKKFRDSFIAIAFGVLITMGLAAKNHGGLSAVAGLDFWKDIGYSMLLAVAVTLILYIYVARKKSLEEKNKANRASRRADFGGSEMMKRPKGKKAGKKKKKKK